MSKLTALQHLGFAYETTYGTPIVPTFWMPTNSVKVEDEIKKIADEGRRANLSKTFAVYDGVTSSKVDVDADLYPDAVGYLLKSILGQDTVTGSSPNFTHAFKVVNAPAPAMTLSHFNSISEHAFAGEILSDLSFKFDAENVASMSAKFLGKKSVAATTSTPTYSTVAPFMGFGTSLKIAGVSNTNIVGGELSIKRDSKLMYSCVNSADVQKVSSGRIELTGKITFDVEDESELSLLGGADKSILLTFAQDINTSLVFSLNTCDFGKATIDTTQEFARVDVEFTALYNTVDAGLCTITLKNNIATY